MHFAFDEDCDAILRQDPQDYGEPSAMSNFVWKLVWEGRRAADRDERFRLYVRIDRPKPPVVKRRKLAQESRLNDENARRPAENRSARGGRC